jgi:hypothetical protein
MANHSNGNLGPFCGWRNLNLSKKQKFIGGKSASFEVD